MNLEISLKVNQILLLCIFDSCRAIGLMHKNEAFLRAFRLLFVFFFCHNFIPLRDININK